MPTHYKIQRLIGEGSYGKVYCAWDCFNQQMVAIKVIRLPAKQEKFGAEIMKKIKHDSVPKVIDYYEDEEYFYLVMTLVCGQSLKDQKHQLNRRQICQLANTLFTIFAQFQDLKVVFGDLKPDNIIWDKQKNFWLIDFGSVSTYCSQPSRYGSFAYASQEYQKAWVIDWRSDLYSLAKTLNILIKRKSFLFKCWYHKATRIDPKNRFKTIREARMALTVWPQIGKWLLVLEWVFALCYIPIRELCYSYCLSKQDFDSAIAILPSRSTAFVAILEDRDVKDQKMWQQLARYGLTKVDSVPFLWDCVNLLAQLNTPYGWHLSKQILSSLDSEQAEEYLRLFDGSQEDVQHFIKRHTGFMARVFAYEYCLSTNISLSTDFYTWIFLILEEDSSLGGQQKWNYFYRFAQQSKEEKWLVHSYYKLPISFLKAKLCYEIFQNGAYSDGWLHCALNILEQLEWTKENELLRTQIEQEIKMWGDRS